MDILGQHKELSRIGTREDSDDDDHSKQPISLTISPSSLINQPTIFNNWMKYEPSIIYNQQQLFATKPTFNMSHSSVSTCHQHSPTTILPNLDIDALCTALSRFRLSFTDTGINMEANISTASEFRSLVEAFGDLSCTTTATTGAVAHNPTPNRRNSVALYRNKSCKTAPVNYPQLVGLLGQILHPHSSHNGIMTLRQMADTCVDTYFNCWVRYTPVLERQTFMTWYLAQEEPQDTLIVNALCSLVFRHTVTHHYSPGLSLFFYDPDRVQQQEEFFFNRARDALAHSFDLPDRFTIIALTFLFARAEPHRRHHYGGLAITLLQQLEIYPRMMKKKKNNDQDDENHTYALEMDTRLWWFVWQIDFAHWTAGSSKITPLLRLASDRYDQVDFPRVFEQQDMDGTDMAILTQSHTLPFWRIQASIIATMYEQELDLTREQLVDFDTQLMDKYNQVPTCLTVIPARIRIHLEYNASRIILHKPFIPDIGDKRPSQAALESLEICLQVTLEQLDLLEKCIEPSTRCAFDLFELWRVGQILSMAMDIHTTIGNDDFNNTLTAFLRQQLERTIYVLEQTPEGMIGTKSWAEVAEFLHNEIRRHGSTRFNVTSTIHLDQPSTISPPSSSPKKKKNQPRHPIRETLITPSTTKRSSSVQGTCMKNQSPPRFRYFNPMKTNKLLFIDESQ